MTRDLLGDGGERGATKASLLFDPQAVFIVDVETVYERAAEHTEKVHDGAPQRQAKEQLDLISPVTVVPLFPDLDLPFIPVC